MMHRTSFSKLLTVCMMLGTLLLPTASPAFASSLTVTRFDDPAAPAPCSVGNCSLRAAVLAANATPGADTIVLASGIYTLSVPGKRENGGLAGDLDITSPITINGTGVTATVVEASTTGPATAVDRVFDVLAGGNLTLNDLTVRNGEPFMAVPDDEEVGGAINVVAGSSLTLRRVALRNNRSGGGGAISSLGTLTIDKSTISSNTVPVAWKGGGIFSSGTFTMTESTVDHNSAVWAGGGLTLGNGPTTLTNVTVSDNATAGRGGGIDASGSLTLNNATITANVAGSETSVEVSPTIIRDGGGIFAYSLASLSIRNSIVSGNLDNYTAHSPNHPDCSGPIISLGYNLIGSTTGCTIQGTTTGKIVGQNPLLGPLASNGGPTQTRAIPPNSPAYDRGSPATPGSTNPTACAARDQRGNTRPGAGSERCDIGAFEY